MNSKKIIPIILIVIMLGICVYLYSKRQKPVEKFNNLQITYNNKIQKYNGTYGEKINIGEVDLVITSVNNDIVVLSSNQNLLINNKESNTIEAKLNENVNVCIKSNDCFIVSLI